MQSTSAMHRVLVLCLLLPACVAPAPTPRVVASSAHALAASNGHTLILTDLDAVTEAGRLAFDGEPIPFPDEPDNNTGIPRGLPAAAAIAVGSRHACLLSAGEVTCWGDHVHGALGAHRTCPSPTDCVLGPELMPTLPSIRAIAAGDDVTCATAEGDEVMCWGKAGARLGGSIVSALAPPVPVMTSPGQPLHAARVMIRDTTVCAIDGYQQAWCWGGAYGASPSHLDLTGVVDLSINADHGCAVASTGLTCWGHNINGQVDPDQAADCEDGCALAPTPVPLAATRVVVGARHTCALDDHGDVWCWGDNEDGQLARTDAFLVGARDLAFAGAIELAAGARHTCAIAADHTAWCWGKN